MNIVPLTGRVLVKKIDVKKVGEILTISSQSGVQNETIRAEIVNIGEFEKDKVFNIKKGDVVIFSPIRANLISYLGEKKEYMIIKAEDILGVELADLNKGKVA